MTPTASMPPHTETSWSHVVPSSLSPPRPPPCLKGEPKHTTGRGGDPIFD